MQCILVDRPTVGFQHNGYFRMRNLFQNTFKSQRYRVQLFYFLLFYYFYHHARQSVCNSLNVH